MAEHWLTVAGGVAGTGIGMAAAGGPENPAAWVTGLACGAIGAWMMKKWAADLRQLFWRGTQGHELRLMLI